MNEIELLSDRAVIRLSGDDRLSFLQGLITQDLERLSRERAIFAALLTPQGKILFDFFVIADDDALLIDCCADIAPSLLKRLALYKLRAKVTLEIDDTLKVGASPEAIDAAVAFADPRLAALGWRAVVSADHPASAKSYNRRRIALGVPEFGADFASDSVFLTDVNYDMLNGVSYKKGCFIGQEVTSRMKRKGDIRRRTLVAKVDGPALPASAPVTAGASTLGEMMSSIDGAGLAAIRLDRWEKAQAEATPVTCEGHALQLSIPAYLEQS